MFSPTCSRAILMQRLSQQIIWSGKRSPSQFGFQPSRPAGLQRFHSPAERRNSRSFRCLLKNTNRSTHCCTYCSQTSLGNGAESEAGEGQQFLALRGTGFRRRLLPAGDRGRSVVPLLRNQSYCKVSGQKAGEGTARSEPGQTVAFSDPEREPSTTERSRTERLQLD